jgi:hypothetical protein
MTVQGKNLLNFPERTVAPPHGSHGGGCLNADRILVAGLAR